LYTEKVMEHFKNPRNMGKIENYDGLGKVGNPVCGDQMFIYIKVKKIKENGENKEILEDIKVETFGCAAAIACASAMTELMIGKTLEEGMKLERVDIANYLGGLPPVKAHCSNLSADGLHTAIEDYKKRNVNTKNPESKESTQIESIVDEVEQIFKEGEEKEISSEEDFKQLDKEWQKLQSKIKK